MDVCNLTIIGLYRYMALSKLVDSNGVISQSFTKPVLSSFNFSFSE